MNLYEILKDADGRVNNTQTRAEKVRWLNQLQRRLFRTVEIPAQLTLKTVKDQALYALPADFPVDRIFRVTVNNVEYPYRRLDQALGSRFYYIILNQFGLYPPPAENDLDVYIFYNKRPVDLCSGMTDEQINNLTDAELQAIEPELPTDYHELYVLGLCEKIAAAQEDVMLKNNYYADFADLLTDMVLQLMNQYPEYPSTRDVMTSAKVADIEEEY